MEVFDYIIVGAGTAGCVLASRLVASGRRRVLLLEAGGSDRRLWIRVPIGYGRTFSDPRVNWMYATEPEPALLGRRVFWPRGKVLGGSGSINGMVYVRGLPHDFDDWQALGNPGWGYREVLPYFRRLEDYPGAPDEYHARGGPISITDVSGAAHPLCRTFIDSCMRLGYPQLADLNGARTEGVSIYQITTRNGLRASTATGYLRPALRQRNLTLRLRAQALRILFHSQRAIGIAYRQRAHTHQARASQGLILCLGAVNTPQLLQLSGVGDTGLLRRHGIEVVAHHPQVGLNLQDHLDFSYGYRARVPTLNDEIHPWRGKLTAAVRYALTRGGPLSMSINQSGGFIRSDADRPRPNMQLYFSPLSYPAARWPVRRLLQPDPFSGLVLSFNPCRPTSRGRIEIRSADPLAAPLIFANYLSTEHDLAEALAGVRRLRSIAATAPLADVIAAQLEPAATGSSDAALLQEFRTRATTCFHPVGSCRMGPDAAAAVVDARLRVHGLSALWVVDASIFPTVTSGNTNTPTIMVAEKAAEMIREEEGDGVSRARQPG
jgi:choline dehydrogenase